MRERKYVRFNVNMYSDTKFKIIDRNSRRDLIHYIWNRLVVLAGKVNKEGELYMSRTIPYTIESLAVEFNREPEEIKLAMDLLIKLEMMEYTKEEVYIVKNFAKHQNIKIKEKDKEVVEKVQEKKEANKEKDIPKESIVEEQVAESKIPEKERHNIKSENCTNIEVEESLSNKQEVNRTELEDSKGGHQMSAEPLSMEENVGKKAEKKKMKSSVISREEDEDEELICTMTDGEYVLGESETIVRSFSFCDDKIINI